MRNKIVVVFVSIFLISFLIISCVKAAEGDPSDDLARPTLILTSWAEACCEFDLQVDNGSGWENYMDWPLRLDVIPGDPTYQGSLIFWHKFE